MDGTACMHFNGSSALAIIWVFDSVMGIKGPPPLFGKVGIDDTSIGKGHKDFTAAATIEAVTPEEIEVNGEDKDPVTEQTSEVITLDEVAHVIDKSGAGIIEKRGLELGEIVAVGDVQDIGVDDIGVTGGRGGGMEGPSCPSCVCAGTNIFWCW